VGKEKNFTGQNFWARGYYVSTVGRDEELVRLRKRVAELEEVSETSFPPKY
jgi:putative transposase